MEWEYYIYVFGDNDPQKLERVLDQFGGIGWELVSVVWRDVSANMYCFFKRKLKG